VLGFFFSPSLQLCVLLLLLLLLVVVVVVVVVVVLPYAFKVHVAAHGAILCLSVWTTWYYTLFVLKIKGVKIRNYR